MLDYMWWASADGIYAAHAEYADKAKPSTFVDSADKKRDSFKNIFGSLPPIVRTI